MTDTDVNPAVAQQMNPVVGQDVPAGNPLFQQPQQLNVEQFKQEIVQAVTDQFAVTGWGTPSSDVKFVIECPSGQRCLAKHLNTIDLIEADLIEEVDIFTKQLFPASFDPAGNPIEPQQDSSNSSFWTTLKDVEKKVRFFRLLHKLLAISIVKPRVIDDGVEVYVDENGERKLRFGISARPLRPGEVYASAIDFADKLTIFAELNKPLELIQPFREES